MRGTSDVFQWANDGTVWYTLKKVFSPLVLASFAVLPRIKLSTKNSRTFCGGQLAILPLQITPVLLAAATTIKFVAVGDGVAAGCHDVAER